MLLPFSYKYRSQLLSQTHPFLSLSRSLSIKNEIFQPFNFILFSITILKHPSFSPNPSKFVRSFTIALKTFSPDRGGSPQPPPSLELLAVERIARRASTLGQIPRRITGHVGPGPLITPANSANWSLRISWFRT